MNDPGLDSTIHDNAAYLDEPQKDDKESEEEAEEDYFIPRLPELSRRFAFLR